MILHFNYEEIRALQSGGQALLDGEGDSGAVVLAPSESRAHVETLLPRLDGDISMETLAELRSVSAGITAIVEHLRTEMEAAVVATHAADEAAVAAYFDFAHVLSVSHRLHEMDGEMLALIELVTGGTVDDEVSSTFRFPD